MQTALLSKFISDNSIKGFLADDEGAALYHLAESVAQYGPCLEIGSYCGKSTVYIGAACRKSSNILYAVDHHRGSEEHQHGEEYHDGDLYDGVNACVDSFPFFRKTLTLASLEENVVPVVAASQVVAKRWNMPLGLVFIDGGHSHQMAMEDCIAWSAKIAPGGIFAVHDIFPRLEDGGHGPYLAFEHVFNSGNFEKIEQVNSLGILKRKQ
ncbi:MAG: putative O-methyltransferase YrrM [Lentisphaeria bacterium]|jgi:predicted O-methyltransferase YrrM